MKKKIWIAVAFCLILCMGILAACNPDQPEGVRWSVKSEEKGANGAWKYAYAYFMHDGTWSAEWNNYELGEGTYEFDGKAGKGALKLKGSGLCDPDKTDETTVEELTIAQSGGKYTFQMWAGGSRVTFVLDPSADLVDDNDDDDDPELPGATLMLELDAAAEEMDTVTANIKLYLDNTFVMNMTGANNITGTWSQESETAPIILKFGEGFEALDDITVTSDPSGYPVVEFSATWVSTNGGFTLTFNFTGSITMG